MKIYKVSAKMIKHGGLLTSKMQGVYCKNLPGRITKADHERIKVKLKNALMNAAKTDWVKQGSFTIILNSVTLLFDSSFTLLDKD